MGVFKRMLTERDDEDAFLYNNGRLQERISDLKARLKELGEMSNEKLQRAQWDYAVNIPRGELGAVLPENLFTEEDVLRAIDIAQEKLLSLWQEYYGEGEDEIEGQISIFDLISPITGTPYAA